MLLAFIFFSGLGALLDEGVLEFVARHDEVQGRDAIQIPTGDHRVDPDSNALLTLLNFTQQPPWSTFSVSRCLITSRPRCVLTSSEEII